MELINLVTEQLSQHVDPIAMLVVILGGLFAKKYLKEINISNTYKTLVLGTIFITVYVIILHMSGKLMKEDYVKYFISYCVATSCYELLVKKLMDIVKAKK